MILRALTALAAPSGARSRLSIFYFHRVLAEADPLLPFEPDARMFDRMLGWIGAQFRVLDPLEACDRLYDGTLPSRPAAITFDDGYRDNHAVALPILQRHGMKAAFFVATGFLEGGAMFNDRVIEAVRRCREGELAIPRSTQRVALGDDRQRQAAIDAILAAVKHLPPDDRAQSVAELERVVGCAAPEGLMMNAAQVAALHRAGMRIGGHTRTHPILTKLEDPVAEREIVGGLEDLGAITGERPQLFAYPNGKPGGDFDARHVEMVRRSGCSYAFTTRAGAAASTAPRHELPRFTPWDRTPLRFAARAWINLLGARADR